MTASARFAMAVALVGLGVLTQGAGPISPTVGAAAAAPQAPTGPAFEPIRLQPARVIYRQIEGTYLKRPLGVFVDQARGEVYVADTSNDLVVVYDRDGVALFAFGYNGEFKEPLKAVVDGHGRIYVLSGVGGMKIRVFNYRGEYLHDFGFAGVPGKPEPVALTADVKGNIYIADAGSGQILVYDTDQQLRLKIGNGPSGGGRFVTVRGLAVDRQGDIYVADASSEFGLQVYSADGRFLRGWGRHDSGPQNFSLPAGVALDGAGRVIVVDTLRQVISMFSPEGVYLARFGGLGTRPGDLAFPSDIATDGERRIYVVERVGSRLQILDEQPVALRGPNGAGQMPPALREELRRSIERVPGRQ